MAREAHMKVVFLRHATRSLHGTGDSPLNTVGKSQADALANYLVPNGPLPLPTRLYCSPKRRAQETLSPLSSALQMDVQVDPRLDERQHSESGQEFEARILNFLKALQDDSSTCSYVCSHLDWLETALVLIDSDMTDLEIATPWATAEFRIFKISEGLWVLKSSGTPPAQG